MLLFSRCYACLLGFLVLTSFSDRTFAQVSSVLPSVDLLAATQPSASLPVVPPEPIQPTLAETAALVAQLSPIQRPTQVAPVVRPLDAKPPSRQPAAEPPPPTTLPPPAELLPVPEGSDQTEIQPGELSGAIVVDRYQIEGSTVFSAEELAQVTAPFTTTVTKRPVSFAEILQARSAITKLYVDRGYVTSGAIILPQSVKDGVVVIKVVEGRLEKINVTGNHRLNPGYVSSRLGIAAKPPLNRDRLLQALQLLQIDPLIQNISADLQAGTRPGTNILEVKVSEADSFSVPISLDNGRAPSVGSFRRQIFVNEANLLGLGDGLSVGYTNTDGSNELNLSYSLPINPRNGKLSFAFGTSRSTVIEEPFDVLDIESKSRYYELSFRQPIVQTPTQEFALGATLSHQTSQTSLGIGDIGPYPLSPGADSEGRTSVSALRFFQEWSQRSSQHVLALRSQFSFGLNLFNSTINDEGPDSRFFAWRGQGQWVRLLAPDTLLLLRTDVQLANQSLLGLEQFGLGGQLSVRGYRQDLLLTDNGLLASAEFRLPILRAPKIRGLLQLAPFVDFGTGWNNSGINPDPRTLVGTGVGLLWRQGDRLTVRLDWGIPLVSVDSQKNTWQENGFYFSINYTPF